MDAQNGTESQKEALRSYLRIAHEALRWKLEGLGEYELRRPLVPTGTNLLGILKHVASVEAGYLGEVFGRPFPQQFPWLAPDAEPNADMWATLEESSAFILDLFDRVCAHSEATLDALDLDALGRVPWWSDDRNPVTLQRIVIHLIAEINRHAGHADILRELIDGEIGWRPNGDAMPEVDAQWWAGYRDRLEETARLAGR